MRISHILEKYGVLWPIALGVVFTNNPQEQAYEQHEADKIRIKNLPMMLKENLSRPTFFPSPKRKKRSRLESLYYMRRYSIGLLL